MSGKPASAVPKFTDARADAWSLAALRWSDGQLEALKWIGLVAMFVDHFGRYLFGLGTDSWAFASGRFAFPLFAFVLAMNLAREGGVLARTERTARRLAFWCVVSILPAYLARDALIPINVFGTLALGATLCALIEARPGAIVAAITFFVAVLLALLVEFGAAGMLLLVTVYVWRRHG
jgi:hypothetical protein